MQWIAAALLLGIFVRHDTAFRIASLTGWSPGATFYVLGALLEIILLVIILLFLCYERRRSVWRNLACVAIGIGICEAALVAGCRMAMQTPPPAGVTTCDHVTGLPIGAVTTMLYLLVLCGTMGSQLWRAERK